MNGPATDPTAPRKVLVTSRFFEPGFKAGGPIRSVAQIVDSAGPRVDVTLITEDRDLGDREPYPQLSGTWADRGRVCAFYLNRRSVSHWVALAGHLRHHHYEVLYLNSFWSPLYSFLPLLAARFGAISATVVIVAPRGEMAPGALSIRRLKKRLAMPVWKWLFGAANLHWHASSEREAADVLRAFPQAEVQVIQNQGGRGPVRPPPAERAPGPVRFVFISRICPMKNLLYALQGLRQVRVPASLDIYGPLEEPEYWRRCLQEIARMPRGIRVEYHGTLSPDEVCDTFWRYDAFVLPTLGENFGHVIAESLSVSCPVICSNATSWTSTLSSGGGAVVADGPPEVLAATLSRWAGLDPASLSRSRLDAGAAYERWRLNLTGVSVLDELCARVSSARRAEPAS